MHLGCDDADGLDLGGARQGSHMGNRAEAYHRNCSLTAVDVRPSPLSGVRNLVDVIFSFTNIEKNFHSR
jgi:hypothetical protein